MGIEVYYHAKNTKDDLEASGIALILFKNVKALLLPIKRRLTVAVIMTLKLLNRSFKEC